VGESVSGRPDECGGDEAVVVGAAGLHGGQERLGGEQGAEDRRRETQQHAADPRRQRVTTRERRTDLVLPR